jgi:hypothetical protein
LFCGALCPTGEPGHVGLLAAKPALVSVRKTSRTVCQRSVRGFLRSVGQHRYQPSELRISGPRRRGASVPPGPSVIPGAWRVLTRPDRVARSRNSRSAGPGPLPGLVLLLLQCGDRRGVGDVLEQLSVAEDPLDPFS